MPEVSNQQLYEAFRKADQRGDVELTRQIGRIIARRSKPQGPGMLKSAARGAIGGTLGFADLASNYLLKPLLDIPSMMTGGRVPQVPKAQSAKMATQALNLPPPVTAGERFAELAGSSFPGGAMALKTAVSKLPVLAAELASVAGAHTGREVGREYGPMGETAGMLLGGMLPYASGTLSRYAAAPYSRYQTKAGQEETLKAFEQQKVPPSLADINDAAFLQKAFSKLPGGYGVNLRLRRDQAAGLEKAIERITVKADKARAGREIQKGASGYVDQFEKRAEELYQRVYAKIPKDTPVGYGNIQDVLENLAAQRGPFQRSLSTPEGRQLEKELAELTRSGLTLEQLKRARSAIGKKLSNITMISAIPRSDLKAIYVGLSKDIGVAAKNAGASIEFDRASKYWKTGMERVDIFLEPLIRKGVVDDVYDLVVGSAKKSPSRVNTIAKTVGAEQREVLLSTMLRNMGEPIPSQRTVDYTFSPETFLTNLNRIDERNFKRLAVGTKYANMADLADIKLIASRVRDIDRILKNPSGTAETLGSMVTVGGVAGAPAFGATMTAQIIGALTQVSALSYGVSRLMTNPKFIKWALAGSKLPASTYANHLARLATVMADQDEQTRQAAADFLETARRIGTSQ